MQLATLLCFLSMGTHFILGALVLSRSPRNPVNRVFSLLLFLFLLWALGELLTIYFGCSETLIKLLFTPIVLLPYVFSRFAAIFPRRLESAPILSKGALGWLLFLPTVILIGLLWAGKLPTLIDPIQFGFILSFGSFEFLAKGIVIGYLLLSLRTLSEAWKNIDSEFQERRLRYTFSALVLPAAAGSIFVALGKWYLSGQTIYTFGIFPTLGIAMAFLLGYAILRYRLMEIDMIFSIGLVYTLLTAILTIGLEVVGNLLQNNLNITGTWSTILTTLVMAAVFSPLKEFIVMIVDKLFGKRSFDATAVLRHLLKEMRQASTAHEVFHRLLRELKPVLNFSSAIVQMKSGIVVTSPIIESVFPPLPPSWPQLEELEALIEEGKETKIFDPAPFEAWFLRGYKLGFPIYHGPEITGAVYFAAKESKLPYSPQEKSLIAGICQEITPILDSLVLMQAVVDRDRASREIEWARRLYGKIQADQSITAIGAYNLRLFSSLAHEIKGDLIDIHNSPDSSFVLLCDAFHNGIQAALTLHIVYSAFRSAPQSERVEAAHRVLAHFSDPPLRSAATCIEITSENLTILNAGNPPPLLFSHNRQPPLPQTAVGKPLGMNGALPVSSARIDLKNGDFLMCATNGLLKAFGDPEGKGFLEYLAAHDREGMDECHALIQDYLTKLPGRSDFPDDITYVLLRKKQ